MVNSKFHLIRSDCEIFFYNFPNIACLKYTVNSNFHLIRSKTWLTNDFELTVPDLYLSNTTVSIYHHYATRHGIPKDWVTSQNLTHFITHDSNADTYN